MPYPSDLSDAEWQILQPVLPEANHFGRPRKYPLRDILNALFYIDRTGCQWRFLPSDFPNWNTVYYYSRKWNLDGTLDIINSTLSRQLRLEYGRDEEPSYALVDAQSVQTSQKGGLPKKRNRQTDRL